MKIIHTIILSLVLVIFMAGCGSEPQKEITNVAEYEGCILELTDAEMFTDGQGTPMVRVDAVYTNNNEDPLYAACSFAVRAFQNDVELDMYTNVEGIDDTITTEVKNGSSIEVSFVFATQNNSSVEVLVGTPTADMETIGRAIYFKAEG